jgi:hypothetical protein
MGGLDVPVIAPALVAALLASADPADAAPPDPRRSFRPDQPSGLVPPPDAGAPPAGPAAQEAETPRGWAVVLAGGVTRLVLPGDFPVRTIHVHAAFEREVGGGVAGRAWLELGASVAGGRTDAGLDVKDLQASLLLWSTPDRVARVGGGLIATAFSFKRAKGGDDETRGGTYGLALAAELLPLRTTRGAFFVRAAGSVRPLPWAFYDLGVVAGVRFGRGAPSDGSGG